MRIRAETGTQHPLTIVRRQVGCAAGAGVIAVCVCNNGACDRLPRIDVEITCRAIQTGIGKVQHGIGHSRRSLHGASHTNHTIEA